MDKHLKGTWEDFEAWIRKTIGSDFCWRVRPEDSRTNREMIAYLILGEIKRNEGVFPGSNVFIESEKDAE